ncbi:MAG TPA: NUDIX hydrolase [Candidatus Paceibacterota bacterium]|nr:NUDIX hydrolase [Candidatus Paceibacterota bacterium]
MEKAPNERIRKVTVEGKEQERDLVIGVCITRSVTDEKGQESIEYLLVRRDLPDGQWYFPGGKVREGETMKDALKRELKEELGLEYGVDYEGPFEGVAAGAYEIKDKNLAVVNVSIPQDSLKIKPQLQGTDAVKGMLWTKDPLSYDLTVQAKEVLGAKTTNAALERVKMRNVPGEV